MPDEVAETQVETPQLEAAPAKQEAAPVEPAAAPAEKPAADAKPVEQPAVDAKPQPVFDIDAWDETVDSLPEAIRPLAMHYATKIAEQESVIAAYERFIEGEDYTAHPAFKAITAEAEAAKAEVLKYKASAAKAVEVEAKLAEVRAEYDALMRQWEEDQKRIADAEVNALMAQHGELLRRPQNQARIQELNKSEAWDLQHYPFLVTLEASDYQQANVLVAEGMKPERALSFIKMMIDSRSKSGQSSKVVAAPTGVKSGNTQKLTKDQKLEQSLSRLIRQ
jgi:hypothetical protein